jgi:hypothetical protein
VSSISRHPGIGPSRLEGHAHGYADLLNGVDDSELTALTDSFALGSCDIRQPLLARPLEAL